MAEKVFLDESVLLEQGSDCLNWIDLRILREENRMFVRGDDMFHIVDPHTEVLLSDIKSSKRETNG
jgi:hypothetical protein